MNIDSCTRGYVSVGHVNVRVRQDLEETHDVQHDGLLVWFASTHVCTTHDSLLYSS